MIRIDGTHGEGGGQILRSSLALSMITGAPFRIDGIRGGRRKPGLMRQHLTAVRAAAEVSGARVEGDEIGSTQLVFEPREVRAGDYVFSIGTAGSTTLVLQTVLAPLLRAGGPSSVVVEGGTHNPMAPPFEFLARSYLPLVERMGPRVSITLERAGFFPAGGGRLRVDIDPVAELEPLDLIERGEVVSRRGRAIVSHLARRIAEREIEVFRRKLSLREEDLLIEAVTDSPGPGNIVLLEFVLESHCEVISSVGSVGRSAEAVAHDAVSQARQYLRSEAPVGLHLSDQVMLPMALAGAGRFRSVGLTRHSTTHLELLAAFLPVGVRVDAMEGQEALVTFG